MMVAFPPAHAATVTYVTPTGATTSGGPVSLRDLHDGNQFYFGLALEFAGKYNRRRAGAQRPLFHIQWYQSLRSDFEQQLQSGDHCRV